MSNAIRRYILEASFPGDTTFWVDNKNEVHEVKFPQSHMDYAHKIFPEIQPLIKDLPKMLDKGWCRCFITEDKELCCIDVAHKFVYHIKDVERNIEAYFGFEGKFDIETH